MTHWPDTPKYVYDPLNTDVNYDKLLL